MRRKVIKQGHNTLTITLPAKWVKKNHVKPGGEIEIDERKHDLLISTRRRDRGRKAEIKVTRPKRLVSRHIFNQYRKGVDEIKIIYDDPIIIKDIYRYLPILMGFEITYQGKDHTIIKNVLKINEKEFDNTMRRYLLITKNLAEETYDAIKSNEFEKLEGIMELEKVQNRLYMFLSRVVTKRPDIVRESLLEYLFIQRVEDLADDYKYICSYILTKRIKKVSKPTQQLMLDVNRVLNHLYNFYYAYNIETGLKILNSKKKIIVQGLKLLETVPKKEIRIVCILNSTIVKIYEAASPVFGIHL